jgi:hypothetical protein
VKKLLKAVGGEGGKSMGLSRGQKKRLKKKEKFINAKILEKKSLETQRLHREKLMALQKK